VIFSAAIIADCPNLDPEILDLAIKATAMILNHHHLQQVMILFPNK
jgi:hypothetical protein